MDFEKFYQAFLAQYQPQAGQTVKTTDDVTSAPFKEKLEAAWNQTVGRNVKALPY